MILLDPIHSFIFRPGYLHIKGGHCLLQKIWHPQYSIYPWIEYVWPIHQNGFWPQVTECKKMVANKLDGICQKVCIFVLKYSSDEMNSLSCKCSILLGLNFVKIKKSFTEMLLFFNSKNFRIICCWKKTCESEPI